MSSVVQKGQKILITNFLILLVLFIVTGHLFSQDETSEVTQQPDADANSAELENQTEQESLKKSMEFTQKGKRLYMSGKYDVAILYFQKAIDENPRNAEALNYYGGSYFHKGEYEKAIEYYSRSIEINNKAYWVIHNKGVANHHNGDYTSAINDYNQTLDIKQNFYRSLYYRGVANFEKGDIDAAMDDFNSALLINPNDNRAWYLLGLCQYQKGEEEKAKKSYHKSLSLTRSVLPYYDKGKNPYGVTETEFQTNSGGQADIEERDRTN